ncbi:MAG: tetratricopeptide repeat protein [Pyrinomonadaceae bacterium]|nr:tetratricopeptide repeat protein [Pyrinomonadaceae bacterium]
MSRRRSAKLLLPTRLTRRMFISLTLSFSLLTCSVQTGSLAAAAPQAEARTLQQGELIERELNGGEAHAYTIALVSNQFLRAVADQRGIDVVLTLLAPDGKKLIEVDSPNGEQGPENILTIIEAAGNHLLEVRSLERQAKPGRYALKLEELRAATPQDKSRVAAVKVYDEAVLLRNQGEADALRMAIKKFEESASLWRAASEQAEESNMLNNIGTLYDTLREYPKALEFYERALGIRRELKDRSGEAQALNNIGSVFENMGEKQKALDYFNQAHAMWRAEGNREGESAALNNLASLYHSMGDNKKALELFNQALPLKRAVGDRSGEAATLNNMGGVYFQLGEKQKALDYFNQALPIVRALGDRRGESFTLVNMGLLYDSLGEKQKALEQYNQALPILQALGERYGESVALNNIGLLYDSLGDKQKALDCYNQALPIIQKLGDRYGEATLMNSIGAVYSSLGEAEKALDYFERSLPLRRALKDRAGEAATLNNIGSSHSALNEKRKAIEHHTQALLLWEAVGDPDGQANTLVNVGQTYDGLTEKQKALDYFSRALQLYRTSGNRRGLAHALTNLGAVYYSLGEKQKALEHYNQALPLRRAVGDKSGESITLYELARFERDAGNLTTARTRIEAALSLIESIRSKVASQELRASYLASVQKFYEFYIDLLMRLHKERPSENFHALALQASEGARARSLLELLAEARADIRQGVVPELLERERILQQRLNSKAEQQARLLRGQHTEEQAAAVAKEITNLTDEYREAQTQIRLRSPRYAALTQPAPLALREIQTEALDAQTLLLEYSLGDERSYLWVATHNSLISYDLPKRALIEEAARRVYHALASRPLPLAQASAAQRDLSLNDAATKYNEAASGLSRMILAPAAAQLKRKRLLIVADGALQYVPFAALPLPRSPESGVGSQESKKNGRRRSDSRLQTPDSGLPLIVEHEIVTLPSASTLAVLRHETAGRKLATKTLAVLADPVFASDDERLKSLTVKAVNSAPQTVFEDRALRTFAAETRSSGEVERRIPRLPGTRREAERILSLAPAAKRMQALDFAASRTTAVSEKLREYRYLHFATHGFFNSTHPELSGIVLSMFDERGAQQNGFLRMHEIFNLQLPSELVVLSACQTGLGKEIKGEGMIGLTRGFMYAGAPRVVVSLWSVSDLATAELMTRFYQGILKDGMRPAAALRAAQIQMLQQKQWQEPFYWAAFTLQGEWR